MPRRREPPDPTALGELSARQRGALRRTQALALGLTDGQLRRQVRVGRWQGSGLPGVHLTHSGPVDPLARAVLDLVDRRTTSDLMITDLVLRVCQRRLTTADLLARALTDRKKIRRRRLLRDLVTEVRDGVASPLERRYRQDVEIAHCFPRGVRNAAEGRPGRRRYRDVRALDVSDPTASSPSSSRISVDVVRSAPFRSRRGGYREDAVDQMLDRVVELLLVLRQEPSGRPAGRPEQ